MNEGEGGWVEEGRGLKRGDNDSIEMNVFRSKIVCSACNQRFQKLFTNYLAIQGTVYPDR